MKKLIIVSAVIILCMAISVLAYAEGKIGTCAGCTSASTTIGGGIYQPSTNVSVYVKSTAATYCENAQHGAAIDPTSGKQFHTLYNTPTIDTATANSTGLPTSCSSDSAY